MSRDPMVDDRWLSHDRDELGVLKPHGPCHSGCGDHAAKPKRARKPKIHHEPASSKTGAAEHGALFLEQDSQGADRYSFPSGHGWAVGALEYIAKMPCAPTAPSAHFCPRCYALATLHEMGIVAKELFAGLRVIAR